MASVVIKSEDTTLKRQINFSDYNTRLKRSNTVEELDKTKYNQSLVNLYKENHKDREPRLSWICANCICHEKCKGYFYESSPDSNGFDCSLVGVTLDGIEAKIESLRIACECASCKHELNWRTTN